MFLFLISYLPYVLLWLLLALVILYNVVYDFNYWKRRGIPFIKPTLFFGNGFEVFAFRSHMGTLLRSFYDKLRLPYFGVYIFNKPFLMLRDPDLIKSVLVKDFDNFCDHNILCDRTIDPIGARTLFLANNPDWKHIHSKLSPFFTCKKLKNITPLIAECAKELSTYVGNNLEEDFLETKKISVKYTTEVITSCVLAAKGGCFENENSQFLEIGKLLFGVTWKRMIVYSSYFMAHWIARLFKLALIPPVVAEFIRNVYCESVQDRVKTNTNRHDLIDFIINMKKEKESSSHNEFYLDDLTTLAGITIFFSAGSETTGSAIFFALYELALHPEMQNRLRMEIKEFTEEGFTYKAVQDMKFLQMILSETLRKYPPLSFVDRVCVKDYQIPGSEVVIEKGTGVFVPLLGLHYDPNYFPDPEKFDPERFSDENKDSILNFTYMPFGGGPRTCIGERFGLLAAKLGIAHVISKYNVEPCPETPLRIQFEPTSMHLSPVGGMPLKYTPLD